MVKEKSKLMACWCQPKNVNSFPFSCLRCEALSGGGGGGEEVRFSLSRQVRILLFIAGEPQKLDKQKYISLGLSFHKLFKITNFQTPWMYW